MYSWGDANSTTVVTRGCHRCTIDADTFSAFFWGGKYDDASQVSMLGMRHAQGWTFCFSSSFHVAAGDTFPFRSSCEEPPLLKHRRDEVRCVSSRMEQEKHECWSNWRRLDDIFGGDGSKRGTSTFVRVKKGYRSHWSHASSWVSAQHLLQVEQELKQCVAKIGALSANNAELHAKLTDARQKIRTYSKKNKMLLSNLSKSSTTEVESSRAAAEGDTHLALATAAKLREEVERVTSQLACREHENVALLQSLREIKEKHFETEAIRAKLEDQVRALQEQHLKQVHDKELEQVTNLDKYVQQVNESLKKIESEKADLVREKEQLVTELRELKELNGNQTLGKVLAVSDKSTETDDDVAVTKMQSPRQNEIATRVELLELQLKREQEKYQDLVMSVQNSCKQREAASIALLDGQRLSFEKKSNDMAESSAQILREFEAYKAASDEAVHESEKRIAFLASCVEECARLVDAPEHEKITTRDIYDTLVGLATSLASVEARRQGAGNKRPLAALTKSKARSQMPRGRQVSASTVKPSQAGNAHFSPSQETSRNLSGEDNYALEMSLQEAQLWRLRAANLQERLRTTLLKNSTFESMLHRSELQMEVLKEELKERMGSESSLAMKHGSLKSDSMRLKNHFATLSSRFSQVCEELQLRDDELQLHRDELIRVRSALQRKSELLTQHKTKAAELKQELEQTKRKADLHATAEKKVAGYQHKSKEQMQMYQDLKHQAEMSRAQEYHLAVQLEKEKERHAGSQVRMKVLRTENSTLRSRLAEVKNELRTRESTGAEMLAVADDGFDEKKRQSTAISALSLQDEVKALRRRVLRKQELILGYKRKAAEMEAESVHLRTQLIDATQANRSLQQDLINQRESTIHHVATMKAAMEAEISQRVDQLDGLRASIYDSLEVFIFCDSSQNEAIRRTRLDDLHPSSSSSSSDGLHSSLWYGLHPEDPSDTALLNMRRWTDLSADDLDALRLRNLAKEGKHRCAKEERKRVLHQVESALERSPEDCRTEICQALDFLCTREQFAARSC